jgi:hypothetical protein
MGTVGVFLQQLLFAIVVFVNRILTALQQNQSLHNARFAHLHELAELLTDSPIKLVCF